MKQNFVWLLYIMFTSMTRTCMIMLHQGKEQPTEIFIFTICSVLKNIFTCEKQTLPWQLVLFLPVQVIHWDKLLQAVYKHGWEWSGIVSGHFQTIIKGKEQPTHVNQGALLRGLAWDVNNLVKRYSRDLILSSYCCQEAMLLKFKATVRLS